MFSRRRLSRAGSLRRSSSYAASLSAQASDVAGGFGVAEAAAVAEHDDLSQGHASRERGEATDLTIGTAAEHVDRAARDQQHLVHPVVVSVDRRPGRILAAFEHRREGGESGLVHPLSGAVLGKRHLARFPPGTGSGQQPFLGPFERHVQVPERSRPGPGRDVRAQPPVPRRRQEADGFRRARTRPRSPRRRRSGRPGSARPPDRRPARRRSRAPCTRSLRSLRALRSRSARRRRS